MGHSTIEKKGGKTSEELAELSRLLDLKESSRKRSRRQKGVKEEVAVLLERNPALMPAVIADTLNISDRRVRQILVELRPAA